jgi:TP901 family phage tail tape measure protein
MLREATDLTAEEQQQAFAQIAKIAHLSADEYDNMASALVFSGNNFPTTESRVVAFTERIVGTATALGIAIDQTLAWGAAVTSSGIQAETGATALRRVLLDMALASKTAGGGVVDMSEDISNASEKITKLQQNIAVTTQRVSEFTDKTHESTKMAADFSLQNMNNDLQEQQELLEGLNTINGKVFEGGSENLQNFAAVANEAFAQSGQSAAAFAAQFGLLPSVLADGRISAQEFGDAFKNDASASLELFIKGLSKMSAIDQIAALDALGLSGQRVGATLLNLAQNTDLLGEALDGAGDAFAEGTALQEEFAKRTATVKSDIQILKNQFTALGITIFNLVRDDLRNIIEAVGNLIDRFSELDPAVQKNILLFAGIAAAIGPILFVIGQLITFIGAVITSLVALSGAIVPVTIGLAAAALAFAVFGPSVIESIQPVINKVKELIGIILGIPQPGSIEAPTLPEGGRSDTAAQQAARAPDLPDPTLIERIQAAMANLRESLHIPPETIETINKLRAAFATAGKVISSVVEAIKRSIDSTLGPSFKALFDTLTETLHSFGLDWSDVWNGVLTIISAVAIVIGGVIIAIIAAIVGIVNAVASALTVFIAFWQEAKVAIEDFIAGITKGLEGFKTTIQGIMQGDVQMILEGLVMSFQGFMQSGLAAVNILVNGVIGAFSVLAAFIFGLFAGIASFLGEFWAQLTGDSNNALLLIAAQFTVLRDGVIQLVGELVAAVTGFFQMLFDTLVGSSIIPDLVNAVIENFVRMGIEVSNEITSLIALAIQKFTEFKNQIVNIITEAQKTVGQKIKMMGDDISNAMGTAAKAVLKLLNAFQSLLGWLMANAEKIITLAGSIGGSVTDMSAAGRESPKFGTEHAFDSLKTWLDTNTNKLASDINSIGNTLTMNLASANNDQLLGALNSVAAPAGDVSNVNTDNSITNNIQGIPVKSETDLAALIDQRIRAARGR